MNYPQLKPAPVRSPAMVLALILAAQLMAVLDASVVITALPSIHRARPTRSGQPAGQPASRPAAYLVLCRGTTTSSSRRWMVAATGMATKAPINPSSVPPIRVAMMVSPGVTFTVCFITRGLTK
jgi:hypothetical protein